MSWDGIDLTQMAGEEKVGDALLDHILMSAIAANQFTLGDMRLQEQAMQVSQGLLVVERLAFGFGFGDTGESELKTNQQARSALIHSSVIGYVDHGRQKGWGVKEWRRYLIRSNPERFPVDARKNIANKLRLEVQLLLLQLGVVKVERKRRLRGLALLHRACHEVGRDDFHYLWGRRLPLSRSSCGQAVRINDMSQFAVGEFIRAEKK